jgi:hypothetical protein
MLFQFYSRHAPNRIAGLGRREQLAVGRSDTPSAAAAGIRLKKTGEKR